MTENARSNWTLHNWLDYLESIQPIKYNLRLENVREVAKILDVLDLKIPVITVGGTNGKGSTVAALTALYIAEGYKVGHFTSPHLIKFNERICINNQQIEDAVAAEIMLEIDNVRGEIEVSYFEAALLCALLYYKNNQVDLIVLEVGMGGRLDATNIIDADLTIITSIALDHQKYLGNDTCAIGREKAGIMRSRKSCIFADDLRPVSIDEQAKKIGCDLVCIGEHYTINVSDDRLIVSHRDFVEFNLPKPHINSKAAASAVVATCLLQDILPVSHDALHRGMHNIIISGRQQIIYHKHQKIVLDVSHNPHGVRSLSQFIGNMSTSGRVHAIFSGLADKDLSGMIEPFVDMVDNWYPVVLQSRRAASHELLEEVLKKSLAKDSIWLYQNIDSAYDAVTNKYVDGDLVIIYGSFLLVGAFMDKLTREISYV